MPLITLAADPSSANYQVMTPTVSGGGYSTSTNYSLTDTISPFVHSLQTATFYSGHSGFVAYPFVSTPVVTATPGDSSVALSWSGATGYLGWTPSAYAIGHATVSGGPYAFTNVGNVVSATQAGLANGTAYYFVVRVLDAFGTTIATSSQVSATPVASSNNNNNSVSGGGGSIISSPPPSTGATVVLSGRAYPGSTVTVLKDAQVVASVNADADANFSVTVAGLSAGSYIFSLYSEDASGNRSSPLSFPVSVTGGVTTAIGGIFLAPTIDVDKSEVKRGDNLSIFGQSVPDGSVTISVHSNPELFFQTQTDASGAYLYTLDTTPLDMGSHITKSKAATSTEISGFSAAVGFIVGDTNVAKQSQSSSDPADLNHDGHVDLIDFSIMAYWYHRTLTGVGLTVDLNGDGVVDLVDFSILASHWTG